MINLTDEQKAQFYKDSTRKELILTTNANWTNKEDTVQSNVNNIESINLCYGANLTNKEFDVNGYNTMTHNETNEMLLNLLLNDLPYNAGNTTDFSKICIHNELFICDKKYVRIFCKLQVSMSEPAGVLGEEMFLNLHYINKSGNSQVYSEPFTWNGTDIFSVAFVIPNDILRIQMFSVRKTVPYVSEWGNFNFFWARIGRILINLSDSNIIPNEAEFISKSVYKTINVEDYMTFKILNNEDLVSESFSLNESLCSQENLKFGLCESANCQITTVNNNYQYKNVPFHVFTKVYTPDSDQLTYSDLYQINFANNSNDFNITRHNSYSLAGKTLSSSYIYSFMNINVGDYANLLKQGNFCYLGIAYKFSNVVLSNGATPAYVRMLFSFRNAGGGYYTTSTGTISWANATSGTYRSRRLCGQWENPDSQVITQFTAYGFVLLDSNQNVITDATITNGTLELWNPIVSVCNTTYESTSQPQYHSPNVAWKDFNISKCLVYNNTIDEYVKTHSAFLVPLGKFRVKEIRNQVSHGLMKKTLTLYDDLVDLEQNAFNWYTKYMFCVDTTTASRYGAEFTRQIFSTFYNFAANMGFYTGPDFIDTLVVQRTYSECRNSMSTSSFSYMIEVLEYAPWYNNIYLSQYSFVPDTSKLYKISLSMMNDQQYQYYNFDPLYRGIGYHAGIYIDETLDDGTHNKYLVDANDYFMVSSNCTSLRVLIPTYAKQTAQGSSEQQLMWNYKIYSTPNPYNLTNGSKRLFYYNYFGDHEIFKVDSSITGRDVIRSLLEVCGCLFRLDRYKGKPEFVYCTKTGMYPSQTLYPADDLYPRVGHDASIYESLYISTQHEDYVIKNIGKIQIFKNYTGNDTESNVQWTYTAPNTDNENTYVIDDNIFYSNAELVYEPDNMPDVSNLLESMYEKICDMSYTPQITKAVGLPFVECGDRIGVITHFGGFETFVYNRTLKGIQALFDTFESKGDEYISGVNEF